MGGTRDFTGKTAMQTDNGSQDSDSRMAATKRLAAALDALENACAQWRERTAEKARKAVQDMQAAAAASTESDDADGADADGLVQRLADAEAENQRLRAENRRLAELRNETLRRLDGLLGELDGVLEK